MKWRLFAMTDFDGRVGRVVLLVLLDISTT
jgi:hypothetical protein